MAQVVTSIRVLESKLHETRWNPLLKAPQGGTGGVVLLDETYGEDFPGGKEVAIDIARLPHYPWNRVA